MNWSLPFNGCESIFLWCPILHLGGDFPTHLGQSKIHCTWPTSHLSLKRGTFLIVFALRIPPWCSGWQMEAMRFQCLIMFECLVRGPNDDLGCPFSLEDFDYHAFMKSRNENAHKASWPNKNQPNSSCDLLCRYQSCCPVCGNDEPRLQIEISHWTILNKWCARWLWDAGSLPWLDVGLEPSCETFSWFAVCSIACEEVRVHVDMIFQKGVSSNASKSGFAMIRPLDSMKES